MKVDLYLLQRVALAQGVTERLEPDGRCTNQSGMKHGAQSRVAD